MDFTATLSDQPIGHAGLTALSRLSSEKIDMNHQDSFGPLSRHQPELPVRRPTAQVTRIARQPTADAPAKVAPRNDLFQFDQAKVHGAKAALTLVADQTRAGEPTVTIECAARAEGAERAYTWDEKLRFQLTGTELQLLTCLLLGGVQELSFRNHGDKWCSVSRQTVAPYAGTSRVTMGQGDAASFSPRTVAIDFATLGQVTALCLRQCAHLLRVPVEIAPTVLRAVARSYTEQVKTNDARASAQDSAGIREAPKIPRK